MSGLLLKVLPGGRPVVRPRFIFSVALTGRCSAFIRVRDVRKTELAFEAECRVTSYY